MSLADTQDAKEILEAYMNDGRGPNSKIRWTIARVLGKMLQILVKVKMGLADTPEAKEILITYLNTGRGPNSKNQRNNARVIGKMFEILAKAVSESINRR